MTAIYSALAERQTSGIERVNDRVSVRTRGVRTRGLAMFVRTKDVLVDGYVYTAAVSDAWLGRNLVCITQLVATHHDETHVGNGQWTIKI